MRHLFWFLALLVACGETDNTERPAAPETLAEGPSAPNLGKADGVTSPALSDPLPDGAVLDAPFQALFAPDDPNLSLELHLIAQVVEARAADPADYAEGENPYRIRYAVYNLRNAQVVEQLAKAETRGVDVQVLIEAKQLDPAKTWNFADEYLIERGFEFSNRRDLGDDGWKTADLIGVKTSGLMHLKTRLYRTPTQHLLLTGSQNPGDNALLNEETLHLVSDPALVERYNAAYESIRDAQPIRNEWDEDAAVNVLFSPGAGGGPRASSKLLEWLEAEEEQILLMVFSLREVTAPGARRSLVEVLQAKAQAGVPVYLITDRKQSDGVDADGNPFYRNDGTEDRLRSAGVHVYEATNRRSPFTAMHHKVAVLGRSQIRVITDASNWSFSALGSSRKLPRNTESMLFIDSESLDGGRTGRRYLAQWFKVLSRYADQSKDDGEPGYDEVVEALVAGDWPTVPVRFVAEAQTEWGEGVAIRGDRDELGAWSETLVKLDTDEANYPTWAGEVDLPIGVPFDWKLVIEGNGTRWEAGENRSGFVRPAPLNVDEVSLQRGSWRSRRDD